MRIERDVVRGDVVGQLAEPGNPPDGWHTAGPSHANVALECGLSFPRTSRRGGHAAPGADLADGGPTIRTVPPVRTYVPDPCATDGS